MGIQLSSITISTTQLQNMLTFYRALGLLFQENKVDKGSNIHRAVVSGIEFSLYGASSIEKDARPRSQLSFNVRDLEGVFQAVKKIPGVHCILDPSVMADGKKAIVLDPDGHSVELFEAL